MMQVDYKNALLYLSQDNQSLSIKVISTNQNARVIRDATVTDNIHPILKKSLVCHTQEQILSLLKEIKSSAECQQYMSLVQSNAQSNVSSFPLFAAIALPTNLSLDEVINNISKRLSKQIEPTKNEAEPKKGHCSLI